MNKLKATKDNALEIFNRYGICIIEDYVNKEDLTILLEEFNKILVDNKSGLDRSKNNRCYRANMSDLINQSPVIDMTPKMFGLAPIFEEHLRQPKIIIREIKNPFAT